MPRKSNLLTDQAGAIVVEYALVVAIIVVGTAGLLAPSRDNGVFEVIRQLYQRMEIVIGMPWL